MTSKFKIFFSGILIAIITTGLYLSYRVEIIEKEFISSTVKSSNYIIKSYKSLNKPESIITEKMLSGYVEKITKKKKNLALIAIADKNYSIKISAKNDKIITSKELYEKITSDFVEDKFTIPQGKKYLIKYYNTQQNNKIKQLKLYIFHNRIQSNRLLAIFPYSPGQKTLVKIGLEILLIIIIFLIITTSIYLILQKNRKIAGMETRSDEQKISDEEINRIKEKHGKNHSDKRDSPEKKKQTKTIDPSKRNIEDNIIPETSVINSNNLGDYIYQLFSKIYNEIKPDVISLYLKVTESTLSKSYELKEESFIKINSESFDVIDIANDIGAELKKSTPILLESGKKIIIPVINDNSILGATVLTRKENFNSEEIKSIKEKLSTTTKEISDYLVVNSVILDKETGFYSKIYFKIRYNELLKEKSDVTLIILSLIEEKLSNIDLALIKKSINTKLRMTTGDSSIISNYDNLLGIILPGIGSEDGGKISDEILNLLTKMKIKISDNKTVKLSPRTGTASSDSIENRNLLEATALKRIKIGN